MKKIRVWFYSNRSEAGFTSRCQVVDASNNVEALRLAESKALDAGFNVSASDCVRIEHLTAMEAKCYV